MKNNLAELDDPTLTEELDAPFLDELLAEENDPYTSVLSPEELAEQRAFLKLFLTTHPVAAPMVRRLRARAAAKASSAVITREGTETEPTSLDSADGATGVKRRAP